MTTVKVETAPNYNVIIGKDLLADCGTYIAQVVKPCKAAILTDDKVKGIYAETVEKSLQGAGFETVVFAFANGEGRKNLQTIEAMLEFLAENEFTRSDLIVTLGGGVVGDMGGFAAATFLRGIRFVQVPTTMLAMVDSSVGGKTGCNLKAGKNLAGAFYQPKLVLCDTNTLNSLSDEMFACGLAEAIKTGMIANEELFDICAKGNCRQNAEQIIEYSVKFKAKVVAQDEKESGLRQILNFGHTMAHSIEKLSDYKIPHGQAVALGMIGICRASLKQGICSAELVERLEACLKINSLPTQIPFNAEEIYRIATADKKRKGNKLTLVLPKIIGDCTLQPMELGDVKAFFEKAF